MHVSVNVHGASSGCYSADPSVTGRVCRARPLRLADTLAAVYEVWSQASVRHLIRFSLEAQTVRADKRACSLRLLASSALAFFLPRRSPPAADEGRAAGEKECARSADTPLLVAGEVLCRLAS